MNLAGLLSDMDAMRACLLSRKGWQLSKKERAVFYRWLKRCEEALELDRNSTGVVERVEPKS